MKNLMYSLKQNINFKNNKFFKFYLLSFSLLNLTYLCLEIYKFKLWETFSLIENIQPSDYNMSMNISGVNNTIETIMIFVNLFCLVMLIVKKFNIKFNINTEQFLTIHIFYLFFTSIFSYILSIIFSVTIGNLIEQLLTAYVITFTVLIYYILKTLHEKIKSLV